MAFSFKKKWEACKGAATALAAVHRRAVAAVKNADNGAKRNARAVQRARERTERAINDLVRRSKLPGYKPPRNSTGGTSAPRRVDYEQIKATAIVAERAAHEALLSARRDVHAAHALMKREAAAAGL
jgi:hypothetical protein